ncbi:MAG: succinoglycan biosynthesis protein [Hyphomicrobiales bacterium]|nr:MAG: succinoglycan biosynthesis protein [Hyphomicrobiales bacterium]
MRFVIAALAMLVAIGSASALEMRGKASIIDGDTLEIGRQSIRLHGIDTPEVGQKCQTSTGKKWRCDQDAMDRLQSLIHGEIICTGTEYDDYDRLLAHCLSADGTDINRVLVAEGYAWAFVRYSRDYVAEEEAARSAGLGIWQGDTQPAWEYRADKWKVAKQKAPDGCPIKGNISKHGQIYHPPWSPWYSRTEISPEKGERWFCSEREALDAGWRAPKWR